MHHDLEKGKKSERELFSKEEIKEFKKAGKIASEALNLGANLIKKGAKPVEILDKVEEYISKKSKPAFPAQISYNEVAAHNCPDEDDEYILENEIVKIDVGVHVNGFIADNATTIDLSGNNDNLIKASREALNAALNIARTGTTIGEIGKAIHEKITKYNLSPIKNLSGHGLGRYKVHTTPSITNFDTGSKVKLEEGQVIAIEPFASTGSGIVYESGTPNVFMQINKKPIRDMIVRKIMKKIDEYHQLPFAKRWLTKEFGKNKTEYALRQLTKLEIIQGYPPLVDSGKGLVSQAEHTIIISEKPIVTTKDLKS